MWQALPRVMRSDAVVSPLSSTLKPGCLRMGFVVNKTTPDFAFPPLQFLHTSFPNHHSTIIWYQCLQGAKDIITSSFFNWGLYFWPSNWLATELGSFDRIWIWSIINGAAIHFYHETFPIVAAWSTSFKLWTNHSFVIHFPFVPKTSAVKMCLHGGCVFCR